MGVLTEYRKQGNTKQSYKNFYNNYKKTERAYPIKSTMCRNGEYRFLRTECGNSWYSVNPNPMKRDGCICPKCGRTVKVVMPE